MKKFEVGDQVRVKSFKKRPNYWNSFGKMDYLMGKVVTVSRMIESGFWTKRGWFLRFEDVELVRSVNFKPIVIYRDGSKVVAVNKENGEQKVARCHPDDEFDFYTGAKIAFDRLMAIKEWQKVGTRIAIIDAGCGARGCNGFIGVVVDDETESYNGLLEKEPHIKVKLLPNGVVWKISQDAEVVVLDK